MIKKNSQYNLVTLISSSSVVVEGLGFNIRNQARTALKISHLCSEKKKWEKIPTQCFNVWVDAFLSINLFQKSLQSSSCRNAGALCCGHIPVVARWQV